MIASPESFFYSSETDHGQCGLPLGNCKCKYIMDIGSFLVARLFEGHRRICNNSVVLTKSDQIFCRELSADDMVL